MVARHGAAACIAVLTMAIGVGCGKKGPPLAPYVLLPDAPSRVTAQRAGDDVFVTLTLPAQNIDKSTPADIRRVEIYAYTATTPPPRARQLELATLVATVPVAAALPEGALLGQRPRTAETKDAAKPGTTVTVTETLGPDAFVPKALPAPPAPAPRASASAAAAVRPAPAGPLRRFYVTVAFSDRGRPGPPSAPVEVPLLTVPEPPSGLQVEYTADAVVLTWQPAGGLIGFLLDNPLPLETLTEDEAPAALAGVLPPGPTRYHVYRALAPDPLVLPSAAALIPAGTVTVPRPITALPVDGLTFTDSVEFDRERCYEVRAVRGTGPAQVESGPTERVCMTPVDVFAPTAPAGLSAVTREGAVDLIWEASPELDVWGYVVLRGTAGDATLQPLNAAPVIETQFTDTTVMPGSRYVYAVVAVDTRLPVPNISAESARIEETAR
jgi:hypothetical protein